MNINELNYINTVYSCLTLNEKQMISQQEFQSLFDKNSSRDSVEEIASRILPVNRDENAQNVQTSSKRYRFTQTTEAINMREALLGTIFTRCYKRSPMMMSDLAAHVDPSKKPYPLWKRVCRISLPEAAANCVGNIYFRIALSAAGIFYTFRYVFRAYEATKTFTAAKLVPFVINNVPLPLIRAGNCVAYIFENKLPILLYLFIAKHAIEFIPNIPRVPSGYMSEAPTLTINNKIDGINGCINSLKATARRVSMLALIDLFVGSQNEVNVALHAALSSLLFISKQCGNFKLYMNNIAVEGKTEMDETNRQNAYAVWVDIVARFAPEAIEEDCRTDQALCA